MTTTSSLGAGAAPADLVRARQVAIEDLLRVCHGGEVAAAAEQDTFSAGLNDDVGHQPGELAGERAAGMRVRRDTRINGHTKGRHDYLRGGVDTGEGTTASSDDTEEAGRQLRRWIYTICS